ncbi:MAG: hypothetical protein NVS3B7_04940 [Candidatus Elarobacter sp.]
MPGIRRTAVMVAAFLLLSAAWATAQSTRQQKLPAGTAVVFVSDGHLDPGAREGSTVDVHLRDPLVLDGIVLAPAGTRAHLIVGGTTDATGKRTPAVSIDGFTINAGLMPVRAISAIVPPIATGAPIDATTLAEVDHFGERYSILVPFPFSLSNDRPAAYYTPTPARTANPHPFDARRRRGSPTAAPSSTPSPADATSTPPSGSSATPQPGATKIPS